ncbi:MAG: hypothetical protein OEL52_05240 [Nitrosopumilus sp.]|nr:hypothetical protein [Nitrosopumilus sp.]MDH3824924.1 hypothetical protein [Nitrosopumilus sp.]
MFFTQSGILDCDVTVSPTATSPTAISNETVSVGVGCSCIAIL